MKKLTIFGSFLAILICIMIISGSTFALFTSESRVNIAVTAGRVKVVATLADPVLYSADPTLTTGDKVIKMDNNDTTGQILATDDNQGLFAGTYYYKQLTGSSFSNAGTATLSDGTLTIERMTPGDKITTVLTVTNSSNVAIKYRLKIDVAATDTTDASTSKLLEILKIKFEGTMYTGLESFASAWIEKVIPATASETYESSVEVIFPLDAFNVYQSNSINLVFTVEAVQGNANTGNAEEPTYYGD